MPDGLTHWLVMGLLPGRSLGRLEGFLQTAVAGESLPGHRFIDLNIRERDAAQVEGFRGSIADGAEMRDVTTKHGVCGGGSFRLF